MSDWTHLSDTVSRSRSQRSCYLCSGRIEQGDQYLRRSGIVHGEGKRSFPMHVDCEAQTRDWDEMDWETFECGSLSRGGEQ